MPRFTAKERDQDEKCFVYDEENDNIIELMEPGDLEHAEKVAAYMNQNIWNIVAGVTGKGNG